MKCPECAGEMRYDRNIHRYVCTRCGLALTTEEREKMITDQRDTLYADRDSDEEKRKRRKEYLNWWLSNKKE